MRQRKFIGGLVGVAVWPRAVRSQQPERHAGITPGDPDRATSVRANRLAASISRQVKDTPWLKTVSNAA
jgi:hypothetical protein